MNIRGLLFDFYNVLYVYHDGKYELNKELIDFTDTIHDKFRLGIISNISSTRLPYHEELEKHYDIIMTSGATGYWKPDAQIYLLASENLGLSPAEIAFVDDSKGHLGGAQKVGMKPILYQDLEKLKKDLAAISHP